MRYEFLLRLPAWSGSGRGVVQLLGRMDETPRALVDRVGLGVDPLSSRQPSQNLHRQRMLQEAEDKKSYHIFRSIKRPYFEE